MIISNLLGERGQPKPEVRAETSPLIKDDTYMNQIKSEKTIKGGNDMTYQ